MNKNMFFDLMGWQGCQQIIITPGEKHYHEGWAGEGEGRRGRKKKPPALGEFIKFLRIDI